MFILCTYHVWVVEVTRSSHHTKVSSIVAIEFQNTPDTVPRVLYVSIVPPNVTICSDLFVIRLQNKKCVSKYISYTPCEDTISPGFGRASITDHSKAAPVRYNVTEKNISKL